MKHCNLCVWADFIEGDRRIFAVELLILSFFLLTFSWLVVFYSVSTFVDYYIPNPVI